VVALMIAPPAAAYLLTDSLPRMIVLSVLIGILGAVSGFWAAILLDANIAGSMATVSGLIFLLVFLLAPERGLLAIAARRARQRREFAGRVLAIHLLNHEGTPQEARESDIVHVEETLRWKGGFAASVIGYAVKRGIVLVDHGRLRLTDQGREYAGKSVVEESIV